MTWVQWIFSVSHINDTSHWNLVLHFLCLCYIVGQICFCKSWCSVLQGFIIHVLGFFLLISPYSSFNFLLLFICHLTNLMQNKTLHSFHHKALIMCVWCPLLQNTFYDTKDDNIKLITLWPSSLQVWIVFLYKFIAKTTIKSFKYYFYPWLKWACL